MNPSSIRLAVAFFLASATALPASAVSCGTFAAPTSCSVTIANVVKYTFSSFSVVSASGTGGGATYQAGDIAIDVATGGGNTGLLTLSKASGGPTPGVVFSANAGNFSSITFTYNVTIEPMGAADRKVIHDTIGGIEGVRSSSVGEDPHRCVVIEPVGAAGDE